jgi:uncharacterized membrane protein YkvA (DUF1232 family)
MWAHTLKREVMTLWFALQHPDTPWYARALCAVVTAYALSPVDLIPDFIPVLGYLDDLLIVPAGVWLLLKLIPAAVLVESRAQAEKWIHEQQAKPRSIGGLAIVVTLWGLGAWALFSWIGP